MKGFSEKPYVHYKFRRYFVYYALDFSKILYVSTCLCHIERIRIK